MNATMMNKRVNRQRGTCTICGCLVPENGGTEFDVILPGATMRAVARVHLVCEAAGTAQVTQWRTGEGISDDDLVIQINP